MHRMNENAIQKSKLKIDLIIRIMKKLLIIPALLLFSCLLPAQGIYNNGGKIVIGSGVYVCISGTGGNLRNETNGTNGVIALNGTLKLDGNYSNNVAGADVLNPIGPSGQVSFTGTNSSRGTSNVHATASFTVFIAGGTRSV